MKHRGWIVFSALLWLLIGGFLLYKGLHLMTQAVFQTDSLCYKMRGVCGSTEQAATILIAAGLFAGFFKGRFILVKTVRRVVLRIAALPLPIHFKEVYAPSYWILVGSMVALGMTFRFLPLPIDLRGTIDIAIGSALIQGAMLYFRSYDSTT